MTVGAAAETGRKRFSPCLSLSFYPNLIIYNARLIFHWPLALSRHLNRSYNLFITLYSSLYFFLLSLSVRREQQKRIDSYSKWSNKLLATYKQFRDYVAKVLSCLENEKNTSRAIDQNGKPLSWHSFTKLESFGLLSQSKKWWITKHASR
jgi:hypothetical protein